MVRRLYCDAEGVEKSPYKSFLKSLVRSIETWNSRLLYSGALCFRTGVRHDSQTIMFVGPSNSEKDLLLVPPRKTTPRIQI